MGTRAFTIIASMSNCMNLCGCNYGRYIGRTVYIIMQYTATAMHRSYWSRINYC